MPISFDGDNIDRITMDGDEVRQVTMDGDTVWTALYIYAGTGASELHKIFQIGENVWTLSPGRVQAVSVDPDRYIYVATDRHIIKYDEYGNEQWDFGGYGDLETKIHDLAVDSSGNVYFVSGETSGTTYNAFVKLNSSGNKQFEKSFGDIVSAVAVNADGYVFIGLRDGTVKKYDTNGNHQWNYILSSPVSYGAMATDNSGGVLVSDGDLYKLGLNGGKDWDYSTSGWISELAVDSAEDIFIGKGDSNDTEKINSSGNQVWSKGGGPVHSLAVDEKGYPYMGHDSEVIKRDPSDGSFIWDYDSPIGTDDDVQGLAADPGTYGAFPSYF